MQINVQGAEIYAYTGGKAFDAAKPTAIFIHGVLCDHSVWALQSRYMANHGWNVLAIDLPGHCKSGGQAPESVEEAAGFIGALMDAANLQQAALIGHSWGSLIAMETAAKLNNRISHLVLVGTAFPMKVSPALLESALNTPEKAIQMLNTFSRATLAPPNGAGSWVFGAGVALGRRVLASNAHTNLLHAGFKACDSYAGGEAAMTQVSCPLLFVLGEQDQMTPPKAAKGLIEAAKGAGKTVSVQIIPNGHNQMTESPDATLFAIRDFLAA
ncbi:alpha/beta fold hydrolase [Comamonas thiooxydans]|uniref:Alpha/beta hydrolase n=1 Tax=Comamonas thiooxydans TaxID=363952 RepID=A0A0E3CHT9_9BURK|nr:alpha/beta hydrolase [Comamonas thiooxydans]KGH16198.1 alpha/beta hydrolase [Comamonas thiooxydans]KGH20641.1 alpha/beta hydrolase [Comamonas thiooxydans]KGH24766.1 alpha/beta hydrolase [Comamonas thiooxydans]